MTYEPWLWRHPLRGYFVLACGIGWGGILIVVSATGFVLGELRPLDTDLIFISMLLGPSPATVVAAVTVWGFVVAVCWWRAPLEPASSNPLFDPLREPVTPRAGAGERGL